MTAVFDGIPLKLEHFSNKSIAYPPIFPALIRNKFSGNSKKVLRYVTL